MLTPSEQKQLVSGDWKKPEPVAPQARGTLRLQLDLRDTSTHRAVSDYEKPKRAKRTCSKGKAHE